MKNSHLMPKTFDTSLACGSADGSSVSHRSHQHPAGSQSTFRGWDTSATSAVSQDPWSSKMQRWWPQGHSFPRAPGLGLTLWVGIICWRSDPLCCVTDGPWHTEICTLNGCWCYDKVIYQREKCSFLKSEWIDLNPSIIEKVISNMLYWVSYRGSLMHQCIAPWLGRLHNLKL